MFNLPLKTILITCLVFLSLDECAYLVVGPLELSQESVQNNLSEDAQDIVSKTVPKRESKSKQKSITSTLSQSNLDDIEIIEEIPYCTNLFRSSIGSKETKNAKTSDSSKKISQEIKEDVKINKESDNINQKASNKEEKTSNKEEKTSIIDNLKRELAKEREKVKKLTNELNFVKKLCDESSLNYIDYDYDSNNLNNEKIQSIHSSLDLFNLINSKNNKFKPKNKKCNNELNLASNEKYRDKIDLIDYKNNSQMLTNNEKINKNLFKDNVYQIPNFSVNNHKNLKNPNILNDLSVFHPNFNSYPIPIHNPNIMLPYKTPNEHSDILRTLYPQFFLDDPNDNFDPITNPKRASGRSWIEPAQIYANNMKQLTAPYQIFPGHMSPDLRFFNIRDRRNYIENNGEDYTKNKKINVGRLLRRRNNMKINSRQNFEPFKRSRLCKTQISAKVENESRFKDKKSPEENESPNKTINLLNGGTKLAFKDKNSPEENDSPFKTRKSSNEGTELAFKDKNSPEEDNEAPLQTINSSNEGIKFAFKDKNSPEENDSPFKTRKSSNEGTELAFKDKNSPVEEINSDFKNNLSKIESNSAFNSENDKINVNDSENEDDDEESNYYESSKGRKPFKHFKDFIDSRKENEKEWNEWSKEYALRNKKYNLNKVSDDKDEDKTKYFVNVDTKKSTYILSKEIKSRPNFICKGNRNNYGSLKVNNKDKCAKSDDQKLSADDNIDEGNDCKNENCIKNLEGNNTENEDIKEMVDDEEWDNKEGNTLSKSTDGKLGTLKKSAHISSKELADDSGKNETENQDHMEFLNESDLVNKAEDNDSVKEVADDNNLVKVLAEDIDAPKEIIEDNGSDKGNDSAKKEVEDNDLTKEIVEGKVSVKQVAEDDNSVKIVAEGNGSAKVLAEGHGLAKEMMAEDDDPAKEEVEDNDSGKEVTEDEVSAKVVEDDDDSVKLEAEDNGSAKELAEENDPAKEEVEDNDSREEVTEGKISAKQLAEDNDSVKIEADENDWKREEAEDDDSLNESNDLTNENENCLNNDNELLTDTDNAVDDDVENEDSKIEEEGTRIKRKNKVKQNNSTKENNNKTK